MSQTTENMETISTLPEPPQAQTVAGGVLLNFPALTAVKLPESVKTLIREEVKRAIQTSIQTEVAKTIEEELSNLSKAA